MVALLLVCARAVHDHTPLRLVGEDDPCRLAPRLNAGLRLRTQDEAALSRPQIRSGLVVEGLLRRMRRSLNGSNRVGWINGGVDPGAAAVAAIARMSLPGRAAGSRRVGVRREGCSPCATGKSGRRNGELTEWIQGARMNVRAEPGTPRIVAAATAGGAPTADGGWAAAEERRRSFGSSNDSYRPKLKNVTPQLQASIDCQCLQQSCVVVSGGQAGAGWATKSHHLESRWQQQLKAASCRTLHAAAADFQQLVGPQAGVSAQQPRRHVLAFILQ